MSSVNLPNIIQCLTRAYYIMFSLTLHASTLKLKASRSIPCGYRVILVKANACRISTSIVLHTVAIFSRLSSLLTKRIPEVLYANSGLRFGISKNPEGHYIRQPLDEIPRCTRPEISIIKTIRSVNLQGNYVYIHSCITWLRASTSLCMVRTQSLTRSVTDFLSRVGC